MVKAFIGCDPGKKGFICLLVPSEGVVEFLSNDATPLCIYDWVKLQSTNYQIPMILIEDVHNIFGVSSKSNFAFGYNTGLITGILAATGLGIDVVSPKIWQKAIGVKSRGNDIKKDVASIANRLYPAVQLYTPRGRLEDGKSDALMLAHYAYTYRYNNG